MLSRVNSMVWMEGSKEDEQTSSWHQNNIIENDVVNKHQEMEIGELSTFKSILDAENEDWYITGGSGATHHHQEAAAMHELSFSPSFTDAAADISNQQMFLHSVDSSASCSPNSASVFNNNVVFNNNLDPSQVNYFLQQKMNPTPLQGNYDVGNSEYLESAMNLSCGLNAQMGTLMTNMRPNNVGFSTGFGSIQPDPNPLMLLNNRCNKILKPLDHNFGAQPTLFQKRAALRKNLGAETTSNQMGVKIVNNAEGLVYDYGGEGGSGGKMKKSSSGDDVEDLITVDGGYDSDDQFLDNKSNGGSAVSGGDHKGKKKKKGLPAKNLMAERRRRKKLNDRLYMLRSVVPKISKMDRASILGDAIDYLKELLQKINELHNELETTAGTPTPTSLYSMSTPSTPVGLIPTPIKQELAFPTPLSSPTGQPPARVEVRVREGRAVNIHMFCGRKPGLLLSTLRAIDNLGLDIQQAVISSFNAFALDIFRAEQWEESQELNPDHIKAVLLDSAGFHGMQL